MDKQLLEIMEIPECAVAFWEQSQTYNLPLRVPYLGMGSSYFATLAFKYMDVPIYPEIASEFYNYLKTDFDYAVILSQSGKSSESLWCTHLFPRYLAISNYSESPLCTAKNIDQVVLLLAGIEDYSSSNTYTNTLLALFKGFGIDASPAIDLLVKRMKAYETKGRQMAEEVFDLMENGALNGLYILGSGPNLATALQAALILSESTKRNFTGLALAQYDHGPKETAENSIVINIMAQGRSYERAVSLNKKIGGAGAHVILVEEPDTEENFSVLHNIVPFNFMAYHLSKLLGIGDTFLVGGKVTEVDQA